MISVAMASYNGEKHIKKQISSILSNLSEIDELVISDDGSTDKTIEIIESFNDKRIRLIYGARKGVNQNFANAISNCKGDYIFLSDQDDIWYSNKVDSVMKIFNKNKNCVLVQHNAKVVDENGNILINSFAKHRKVRAGFLKNWMRNSYHGCCMAFKKDLVINILPMPQKGCFHDQWIGLIANLKGNTIFCDTILMEYKRFENNASSFTHYPFIKQLKNRIIIMINIFLYAVKSNKRL